MSASEGNADIVGRADLMGTRPSQTSAAGINEHPVREWSPATGT